jgi:hypothetical protein
LEKDVVSTVSNNTSSSKAVLSPKSLQSKENTTNTKVAVKERGTTSPNSVMTKRSTPASVVATK